MNRFTLTAATQVEFVAKANIVRAIGGTVTEVGGIAHGAVTLTIVMTDGQLATFQLIRKIENHEATFTAMHSLVIALGGHIEDGSMTYLNGKMKPTIKLPPLQRETYLMMQGIEFS